MSTHLTLCDAPEGEPLTKERVRAALDEISNESPLKALLNARGDEVRCRIEFRARDRDCASFRIYFKRNRVDGETRGHAGPLLFWCFHSLAAVLRCHVEDPQAGEIITTSSPESYAADAVAIVAEHELDAMAVRPDKKVRPGADTRSVAAFLSALLQDGKLELSKATGAALAKFESLANDPEGLYEALLDDPDVDEVFLSGREFITAFVAYLEG